MEVVWKILNYQCTHESLHTMVKVDTTSYGNTLGKNAKPRDADGCTSLHCADEDTDPAFPALLGAATAHVKKENFGVIPVHSGI